MAAKASGLTRHGRPGPVLLDFPKDIQIALVPAAAPDVQPSADLGVETTGPLAEAAIKRTASLISNASRTVLYGGGGLIHSGIGKIGRTRGREDVRECGWNRGEAG